MGKYGTAREATDGHIIRRMRFACWITKVTDTHSEYEYVNTYGFSTATTVTRTRLSVMSYVHWLPGLNYTTLKNQLDATGVFIADLIACSTCFGHHYAHLQEPKSIIQWLLPVVFRAVVFKLLVWCGAEGYVSGLQDAAASCKPDT